MLRILEILLTPVPTRTWAKISQSWKPLTGIIAIMKTMMFLLRAFILVLGPRAQGPLVGASMGSQGPSLALVPVRGFHDWLISAQVRVGTGVGRISRILGVPRVSQ